MKKLSKLRKFLNESGRLWRLLANFWMILAMIFFFLAFVFNSFYNHLANVSAIIYLAVLSIYVGTKEFSRWHHLHKSIHYGELSVIIWTIILIAMIVLSIIYKGSFHFSNELVTLYIAVLGIFAITQESKSLYKIDIKK